MHGLCAGRAYMHFERRCGERARRGRLSEGPGLLLAQLLVTLSTQQGAERVEQTAAFRGRPTMTEPMRALLWGPMDPLVAGARRVAYERVAAHS